MAAADALSDGVAAIEDGDGDSAGAEVAGADEADDAEVDPPHAVRPSRAAAARPVTVKAVFLMDCISILLDECADHCVPTCRAPALGRCLTGYSADRRARMGGDRKFILAACCPA